MIVHHRMEVSDEVRRAIRKRLGRSGLATRAEVNRELARLWTTFTERAENPVPLSAPERPAEIHRAVELSMFTTDTLQAVLAARRAS